MRSALRPVAIPSARDDIAICFVGRWENSTCLVSKFGQTPLSPPLTINRSGQLDEQGTLGRIEPTDQAAQVAASEVKAFLARDSFIEHVIFVAFGDDVWNALCRSVGHGATVVSGPRDSR